MSAPKYETLLVIARRYVRSFTSSRFKSPFPIYWNGTCGRSKRMPLYDEQDELPSEVDRRDKKRFTLELGPKYHQTNLPQLRDYTGCQPTGYISAATGEFVHVPEMVPEIIAPASFGKFGPYVDVKTDDEKTGNPDFPRQKETAKTLFKEIYADKVRNEFEIGEKLNQ